MIIEIKSELGNFISEVNEKDWTLNLPWLKKGDRLVFFLNDNDELEIIPIKKLPSQKTGNSIRRENEK